MCMLKPYKTYVQCHKECEMPCSSTSSSTIASSTLATSTTLSVDVVKKSEIVQGDCYSIIKPCVRKCNGDRKGCTDKCCKDLCTNNPGCFGDPIFCPCDNAQLVKKEDPPVVEAVDPPVSPCWNLLKPCLSVRIPIVLQKERPR